MEGHRQFRGVVASDSPVEPRKSGNTEEPTKGSFQQQIEARVQTSRQQGVVLALPALCDRLSLSPFEKNLILMGIAPEVHRRYAQLYEYLQCKESVRASLPSVDLALRLFCRNDQEWKVARSSFTESSSLIQHQLIERVFDQEAPLLNRQIKLADAWVNFLLSDRPDLSQMDQLLNRQTNIVVNRTTLEIKKSQFSGSISDLVLPDLLLETLQNLCCKIQFCPQIDEAWGFENASPGIIALMVGAKGTGKTIATQAIAQALDRSVASIDLAAVTHHAELLQEIVVQDPTILLMKSAQIWLGRRSPLTPAQIHQFTQARQSSQSLTFFSVEKLPAIQHVWRQKIHPILTFPIPDRAARSRLWKQAFPPQVPLDKNIDWELLASKFVLTGGEIHAIARSAAFAVIADLDPKLTMQHLLKAINSHS